MAKKMPMTKEERDLLIRCCNFVLAGEWPWEPEKDGEREMLQNLEARLWTVDPSEGSR